ncbi:MAG: SMP-30/gluconolactonase/LRE family protein [Burkholderiales bacterium]|nr:SMP-30/gluconolactonase/LRE family protein [Burkholderiales bacterium]
MTAGTAGTAGAAWAALPVPPSLLGESPFWHPDEAALYWCDIPGRRLHRHVPATGSHRQWSFESEPACCAPLPGGALLLAMRDGLFVFDPSRGERGERKRLVEPPYDAAQQRFNDGKADPLGRFWVSTVFEPRTAARAALYRYAAARIDRMAGDATVGNGLAFSPDARTLYWADTTSHRIDAFDFDLTAGALSNRRPFAQFALKAAGQDLAVYGGRPDGAAVDAEGALWVAMFEGQRLVRLAPDGRVLQELPLPVRCPTMPCFGGADLKTLFVTTSREKRPAAELAAQPLAGAVLSLRVEVPGLPVNFARE